MPTASFLDHPERFRRLDPAGVGASIALLPQQLGQVQRETVAFRLPVSYRTLDHLVAHGMGGSTLGSHILRSVYAPRLPVPWTILRGYDLPAFVGPRTLFIASSYSGNTEETVGSIRIARRRRAKVVVLATGGALLRLARRYRLPYVQFTPTFNPSGAPRIGLGYSIGGHLAVLVAVGLLPARVVGEWTAAAQAVGTRFDVRRPIATNPAKQLASVCVGKLPVVVAAEFLAGNAHTAANQFNETAKTFAPYFLLPELNHHLLEGLAFPRENRRLLRFVFFASDGYHPRVRRRLQITRDSIARMGIATTVYRVRASDAAGAAAEVLALSSFATYYLGLRYGRDPVAIPYVDAFKRRLGG